jgi:hypothetical protein
VGAKKSKAKMTAQKAEFVLDSSATIAWAFDDEINSVAESLLERMPELRAHGSVNLVDRDCECSVGRRTASSCNRGRYAKVFHSFELFGN